MRIAMRVYQDVYLAFEKFSSVFVDSGIFFDALA